MQFLKREQAAFLGFSAHASIALPLSFLLKELLDVQCNRELVVFLPLFGSIKLTGRNLFIVPHLSEVFSTLHLQLWFS